MDRARIDDAVTAALAAQLALAPEAVEAERSLEDLGLDSHGLMRVLLAIEEALGLDQELELPDEALDTPTTLAAGVAAAVG